MSDSVRGGLQRRCRPCSRGLLLSVLWMAVACSPTFNWRALRPEGTSLQALMPCKPETATRAVPLDGGTPTELHMHSCETGGVTFAVAWAALDDAARVPAALSGWRRASLSAVRVDPSRVDEPAFQWSARVPGATHVQGLVAQGLDHQGRPVPMRVLHFVNGVQVIQAAVYGPASPDVLAVFFEGLQLP